jgi:hypothetical protein
VMHTTYHDHFVLQSTNEYTKTLRDKNTTYTEHCGGVTLARGGRNPTQVVGPPDGERTASLELEEGHGRVR